MCVLCGCRDEVNPKYKKKIELMVRKPEKDPEEVEEALVPCAFCNLPGPETELQCYSCQNIIPFDIATGKRMQMSDWAECPSCRFPCGAAQFIRIIAAEKHCPMCNEEVNLDSVRRVPDPMASLKKMSSEAAASIGGGVSAGMPGGKDGRASGGVNLNLPLSHANFSSGAAAAAVAALAYA